ncbi:MAG: hypothetical protein ACREGE_03630 [Candidatus Microsaccharimonas sp.]
MRRALIAMRKGVIMVTALVLVAGYPLTTVMADAQEPVPPAPETTQTTAPEGAPAPTSETPPAEEEKPKLTYTYDAEHEKWNSEKWQFNPQTGKYEPTPTPIIIEPNPVTDDSESSLDADIDTDVTLDTSVNSNATSGDANVSSNTTGGNATSGDANVSATVMNIVNSSIATSGNQKITTFTQDIMGDVKGDIMLYPLLLKAMLEAGANKDNSTQSTPDSTTINAETDVDVNNDLNLIAKSGDATVDSNTTGGNATSGSATAMANVVNILNSMIAAQQSFIGEINIYGSLEGDILIAPDFIPQLLANNGGVGDESDLKLSTQDTTDIVNNISAVAGSGAASVFGNTEAGNATSGDADSNVVIFNVTGHEIVAENSMLVFVNVMGKWAGMIMDAPGATAAMIGSGVTTNQKYTPDLTINSTSNHGITNTIAVSAESGDAVVSNNTTGGNAVSGQAKAMANVANISGSNINLSGWFVTWFINITDNWYGDLGNNTAYGNAVDVPAPTGPIQFIPAKEQPANTPQPAPQFRVIDSRLIRNAESIIDANTTVKAVLADSTVTKAAAVTNSNAPFDDIVEESSDYRIWIVAGSIFVVGASVLGIRRILQS